MINQIRIRAQFFTFGASTFRSGRCDGLQGVGRGRTLYSSSDLEGSGKLLDEDEGDDGGEEDPKTVGQDPVDDERVPVVVAGLAPSAAVVL